MKKVLFIVSILLFSCTFTTHQKIEKLVKSYLDTVLNDPHSYESVSFGKLDTSFLSWEQTIPEGKRLDTLAASFIDSSAKYKRLSDSFLYSASAGSFHKYEKFLKLDTLFSRKSDSVEAIVKEKGAGFKGPIKFYYIKHTYRAKNGFGALGLHTTEFTIDSAISKVVSTSSVD